MTSGEAMIGKALEITQRLCIEFEGVRLQPYLCPAGVATLGIGCTTYPSGIPVTLRDPPITLDVALLMLRWKLLKEFIPGTLALCPGITKASQLAAITDFAFNLGLSRLRTSTLRRRINAGRWEDAPDELRKWTLAGGRRLNGLVKRREAEIALL